VRKLVYLIGLLALNIFANDLPTDGPFQINHPNGKLYLKGELKNDKKEGTWEFYYDNGQLQAVEKYSGGSPVGIWKYYEENGRLIKKIDQLMDNSSGLMAPDGLEQNMDCKMDYGFCYTEFIDMILDS
jgi:antitoxin component YwqK of YwqJK toxin-antitoxin module